MKLLLFTIIILITTLTGCWPEDESIEPTYIHIDTNDTTYITNLVSIPYSIYDYQIYFNLNSNELVSFNYNNDWDLGFECTSDGQHIILNSADLFEVANLGSVDFSTTQTLPTDAKFNFDASSGNFDSLAIMGWVNTKKDPYEYSKNLYILGKKEGLKYKAYRKMKFINLTSSSFTMIIGDMDAIVPDTFIIEKDPSINFICYKLIGEVTKKNIEPLQNNWDIKFSTYSSILLTEEGIPTNYSVRGTLINPNETMTGKWYINESVANSTNLIDTIFAAIDSTYIDSVSFKKEWDAIGWDWKVVTIDESTNTAFYKADPRLVYIIKSSTNQYFKLHFIAYYNTMGVKGFPSFEYAQIK